MPNPLRLGIAGLGTVGMGVLRILETQGDLIAARAGRTVVATAVSARDRTRDRGVDLSVLGWEDDARALALRDDVDLVVELIGGDEGVALDLVRGALAAGKGVVTANKAMLAHHGQELALAAEKAGLPLRYEAAVAGGIPVIKALAEGLAGNRIGRVMGVMNGTCNYILTRMETGRLPYTEVFAEADALGYLEADPNLDVGGIDAAHKLVILSAISFGTQVDFAGARLQGISEITIEDIIAARDMGYRIKLLGLAQMTDAGLEQSMMPCLVPYNSPLGQLEGGTNMVVIEGDAVGQVVLRGAGAGAGPTASAVLGDVVDIARGAVVPIFGSPAKDLVAARPAQSSTPSNWYIRLRLRDAPGVLAKVAGALGAEGVSIDRLRQQAHQPGEAAPVLIVTHPAAPASVEAALAAIEGTDDSAAAPIALRIVEV